MRLPTVFTGVLLLPAAGILVSFYLGVAGLFAVASLGASGGSGGSFANFFHNETYLAILARTHAMAIAVAVATVLLAYPIAAAMAKSPRVAAVMMIVVLLPLFTSVVVRSFGWTILLSPRGLVAWVLKELFGPGIPLPRLMYNFFGVFIGLVHILLPFAVLSVYPVRSAIPRSLVEASQSLGASPSRVLWRVLLPLSSPGLFSGFTVVYLVAAGAIVTPLMLGGASNETLGSLIYTNMIRYFDFKSGAVYACVLTLSCLIVVVPVFLADRWVTRHVGTVS